MEVDVLVGSPPCQSFSLANRRNSNTSEGSLLYLSFIKYLKFYKPKIFVLENVIGLLSYKLKDGLQLIDIMVESLSESYVVKITKVCCSDFDVPQRRKRLFIIGIRKNLGMAFPELKTHPCIKSLQHFLLVEEVVPKNYFLSKKQLVVFYEEKL